MAQFNIRVYGILLYNNCVLVSDEIIKGKFYTKFPGGGLEIGEGTRDCLKREFREETGLNVEVGNHIYTTDFYQASAFHTDQQIISVYYFVSSEEAQQLPTSDAKNNFTEKQLKAGKDCEIFRWIPLAELTEEDVSLPIDKIVVRMLLAR